MIIAITPKKNPNSSFHDRFEKNLAIPTTAFLRPTNGKVKAPRARPITTGKHKTNSNAPTIVQNI